MAIYLEDKPITDKDLAAMAARCKRVEVTRRSDNSGCEVAFILDETEQYLGFVGNEAHGDGVWLYYTSDVAAFIKMANPEAEVNAWTHYGQPVHYDEALFQFSV